MSENSNILDLATKLIPVILFVASAIYFILKPDGALKLIKENVISEILRRKSEQKVDKSKSAIVMKQAGLLNVDACEFIPNGSDDDISILNKLFLPHAVLIGKMNGPCSLQSAGELSLPSTQANLSNKFRAQKGLNESHGLLTARDVMQDFDFRELRYWDSDYSDVNALRESGAKPPILSSGGIIVCCDEGKVILHRRSSHAGTYPNARHILGGSFKPRTTNLLNDNDDLDYTARRELNEETGNSLGSKAFDLSAGLRVSSVELSSGFIQITHLGINITSEQLQNLKSTPEGG